MKKLAMILAVTMLLSLSAAAEGAFKAILPDEYDDIIPHPYLGMDTGIYSVLQGEKWSTVGEDGKEILPGRITGIMNYPLMNYPLMEMSSGNMSAYFDRSGKEVFTFNAPWSAGTGSVYDGFTQLYHIETNTGMINNPNLNIRVQYKMQSLPSVFEPISDTLVLIGDQTPICGVLNMRTGEWAVPYKFRSGDIKFSSKYVSVSQPKGSYVLDMFGSKVIDTGYDEIGQFYGNIAAAKFSDKYGLINSGGKVLLKFEYDSLQVVTENLIIARKNNLLGAVDASGNEVIPIRFDSGYSADGFISMSLGTRMTLYNYSGKLLSDGEYDYMRQNVGGPLQPYMIQGYMIVGKDGLEGVINIDGKVITPCIASSVNAYTGKLLWYNIGQEQFIVNSYGTFVSTLDEPVNYAWSFLTPSNCFLTQRNGKYGLRSPSWQFLLDCEYDRIEDSGSGFLELTKDGKTSFAYIDGEPVFPTDDAVQNSYNLLDGHLATVQQHGKFRLIEIPKKADALGDHPSFWCRDDIELAAQKLIPETMLCGYQDNITREDFCKLISRLLIQKKQKGYSAILAEKSGIAYKSPYYDCNQFDVVLASQLGIVGGKGGGMFDPQGEITREEAAKILTLVSKELGNDTSASPADFTDIADAGAWALPYIDYMSKAGIMRGTADGLFSPKGKYNREQAYITMLRLYNGE